MSVAALAVLLLCGVLLAVLGLRLANPLPPLAGRPASAAFSDTGDTALGRGLAAAKAAHAGLSGVAIIPLGHEAFAVRHQLIAAAERSIDAQYYIWRGDLTGKLLMLDLLQAAGRGVRVRLLLDDNPTAGLDALWSTVAAHPNIEVRLFNPFAIRRPRILNYLTDFKRLNRRMHNKSLSIDNQAAVLGGRNIGDEYFNATDQMQFADMDVLATGAVVGDISRAFDSYWTSASAFPLQQVVKIPETDIARQRAELAQTATSEDGQAYLLSASKPGLVSTLLEGSAHLEWLVAELHCDDPAKGLGDIPRRRLLATGLLAALDGAKTSFDAASAYFVPGRIGAGFIRKLSRAGREVRVLTNSLASTDVAAVHAGYARYRRRLLRSGVKLFEMKPQREQPHSGRQQHHDRKFPRLGSSRSSLHAKLFLIDRERLFIGSFNFDPRSIYLNTEMGILISSKRIGAAVGKQMDELATHACFAPQLGRMGRLSWLDVSSGATVAIDTEPQSSLGQRLLVRAISPLPVEWLL